MGVTTLTVREMAAADVPAVVEVERASFDTPWDPSAFESELSAAGRHYMVGESGRRIVAYGGLMVLGRDAHVMTIAVHPDHRSRDIGARIMLRLVDTAIQCGAEHLTLEVRPTNESARRLYDRFGFRSVGLRPRYYRDEDALVMWAVDVTEPSYTARLDRIKRELS